jgi:hypothetical protein
MAVWDRFHSYTRSPDTPRRLRLVGMALVGRRRSYTQVNPRDSDPLRGAGTHMEGAPKIGGPQGDALASLALIWVHLRQVFYVL